MLHSSLFHRLNPLAHADAPTTTLAQSGHHTSPNTVLSLSLCLLSPRPSHPPATKFVSLSEVKCVVPNVEPVSYIFSHFFQEKKRGLLVWAKKRKGLLSPTRGSPLPPSFFHYTFPTQTRAEKSPMNKEPPADKM